MKFITSLCTEPCAPVAVALNPCFCICAWLALRSSRASFPTSELDPLYRIALSQIRLMSCNATGHCMLYLSLDMKMIP